MDGRILVTPLIMIRGAVPEIWRNEFPNNTRQVFTTLDVAKGCALKKEIPESAISFFPVVTTLVREEVRKPLVQPTLF